MNPMDGGADWYHLTEPLLKGITEAFGSLVVRRLGVRHGADAPQVSQYSRGVRSHVRAVVGWSSSVEFFGQGVAKTVDHDTVALTILGVARRFQPAEPGTEKLTEQDLLGGPSNYLLLGEPGSGKTTTLKRLARQMLASPEQDTDNLQFPIVVLLRDLKQGESLYAMVASRLGLSAERREITTVTEARVPDESARRTVKYEIWIEHARADAFLADFLDDTQAILIIDGLDEVVGFDRGRVLDEIQTLGLGLERAKIILSCRTGEHSSLVSNFDVVELSPLTPNQVETIARKWLGSKTPQFLEDLARTPYQDLADRPLLLTLLLSIYSRDGTLPPQPVIVYKQTINLLLREWDEQRRLDPASRRGKYSRLDPESKLDLLSAIAHHLIYAKRLKSFSERDLEDAYGKVCGSSGLSSRDARYVVGDLQTHTGLIAAVRDGFEFSHLSMQEYLAAHFLVRSAWISGRSYLADYLPPVAIAVAISTTPGAWLAQVVLGELWFTKLPETELMVFLKRLVYEKPFFETSELLGAAIVRLYRKAAEERSNTLMEGLERLCALDGVEASIGHALRLFRISAPTARSYGMCVLSPLELMKLPYRLEIHDGTLPRELMRRIAQQTKSELHIRTRNGRSVAVVPTHSSWKYIVGDLED